MLLSNLALITGTNPQEMTEANVHKIYQRFKDAVLKALGED
jgi:hypothetical protein